MNDLPIFRNCFGSAVVPPIQHGMTPLNSATKNRRWAMLSWFRKGDNTSSGMVTNADADTTSIGIISSQNSQLSSTQSSSTLDSTTIPPTPEKVISVIIPQFIKYLPPRSVSALKPKNEVIEELQKKKERLCNQIDKEFTTNEVITRPELITLINSLGIEADLVIKAYIKAVGDAAIKQAKTYIHDIILPLTSDNSLFNGIRNKYALNKLINEKKTQVTNHLISLVTTHHSSWYISEHDIGFEMEFDVWANTVNGMLVLSYLSFYTRMIRKL